MSDIVDSTQGLSVQVADSATPDMPPTACTAGCARASHAGVSDTDQEVEELQLNLLRAMTPAERLNIALRLSRDIADACKAAIRRAHPEFSEDQLGEKFVELQYGKALSEELQRYRTNRNRTEPAQHE